METITQTKKRTNQHFSNVRSGVSFSTVLELCSLINHTNIMPGPIQMKNTHFYYRNITTFRKFF